MSGTLGWLLSGAGVFTLALGLVHIAVPALLDYRAPMLSEVAAKLPRPFHVWPTRYQVTARDRYGIIWMMNLAASYGLITIALADLFAQTWLRGPGSLVSLWIAGWWLVRAAAELALGRRLGDWLIMAWFVALGVIHVWVALAR